MAKNNAIATVSNESFLALQDFNFSDVMAEEMSGFPLPSSASRFPSAAARCSRFREMIPMMWIP